MNVFKSLNLIALVVLLGLVAFRPWRSINEAAGLRNTADSVSIQGEESDSLLFPQPIQVVLPQSTVDSLVTQVNGQLAEKEKLEGQSQKLDKLLVSLKKKNAEKVSALVSEKEIQAILAKQQGKPVPDQESDLEKELNKPARSGPK